MSINGSTFHGSCLCGQVRYVVNSELTSADHCHCSQCQRQHGAPFSTYADFTPGSFNWLAGVGLVKTYEVPSGGGWCFCSVCGSTLAGADNGLITSITMATLDKEPGIKPECHIYVGSKANWDNIHDDLPQYSERRPID